MIDGFDPLEVARAFAHRSPRELEAISLAARLVREVNKRLLEARQSDSSVGRVRALERTKESLAVLLALRGEYPFLDLQRLAAVETDIGRLERNYRSAGLYELERLAPRPPGADQGLASIFAAALSRPSPPATPPHRMSAAGVGGVQSLRRTVQ